MEMEQMMSHLLAEIRTSQEHMKEMMDANLKDMMARLEVKWMQNGSH
jgi:hypothetical protein